MVGKTSSLGNFKIFRINGKINSLTYIKLLKDQFMDNAINDEKMVFWTE